MIDLLSTCSWARGQRTLNRPSTTETVLNQGMMGSILLGPFRQSFGRAMKGYASIILLVAILVGIACPATIAGPISNFVINPINGVASRRPATHIRQKHFKTISPSLTHSYSGTSISRVGIVVFIKTPALNTGPCFVFQAPRPPLTFAVSSFTLSRNCGAAASATQSLTCSKITCENVFHRPTFAPALPIAFTAIRNNDPLTHFQASQVFYVWMSFHDDFLIGGEV